MSSLSYRSNKKKEKVKKEKSLKTYEDREDEINTIKAKVRGLGLSVEFPSISEIFKIMDEFVKTGNVISGKMDLGAESRYIEYRFTNKKNVSNLFAIKKKDTIINVNHRVDPGQLRRKIKLEKKQAKFVNLKEKNKD